MSASAARRRFLSTLYSWYTGQPPRTAREAPEPRRENPPMRILSDAHEPDTLPAIGDPHAPETP
jgi:hypothetical protein